FKEIRMTSATSRIGERLRVATNLAALAAWLAVGSVAFAQTETIGAAPSVKVPYGDLNLSTEQGSLALYARIESAAKVVCRPVDIRDLGAMAAAQTCRTLALANAVRDVKSPKLAALYAARARHG
ncbi:MAG: UrcA family protein, partial [Steroidobacteraceae bacterium]